MTIEKIPFPYTFEDCNPRYQLLNQVNKMFNNREDRITILPLFKFMGILKEKFCSSCSLRSLDEDIGHSDTIGVILEDMKTLKRVKIDQDYITGYHSTTDETFLAINLPEAVASEIQEAFVMILWRKGRIFTPEDVIIARTCVTLFFSLCRDAFASKQYMSTQITSYEMLKKAASIPTEEMTPQAMAFLYGEALDLVCKSVVITGKDGTLIHMNKCAENLFNRPFSTEEMIHSYSSGIDWFAGLLHPDDLQNLVNKWNSAQSSSEGFTVEFRLQIVESKPEYHLFRCQSRPVKDGNGRVQYWLFCMFDMEMSRLMEETKLSAVRKTKFLAEMSHGKQECYI
jgi:hypothetical protein